MADDLTQRRLLTAARDHARRRAAPAGRIARSLSQGKRLRDHARRQAALAALTIELAATTEPQAVLERAVDAASKLLAAHTVAAFLCRADRRRFDAAAARGLAPL